MRKRIYFTVFLFAMTMGPLYAKVEPFATLSLGADYIGLQHKQNITFIPPFQNSYIGSMHQTQFIGGVLLGIQTPITKNFEGQIGVSYYSGNKFKTSGVIYQFASPKFANLGYQYNIQTQSLYLEGKLLANWHEQYHPFINFGVGQARNKASDYYEFPLSSHAVPADAVFANHSSNVFSYMLGIGLEKELTQHIRLGGSYRWVGLNDVHLGLSPYQESNSSRLNYKLNARVFVLQLSYLG